METTKRYELNKELAQMLKGGVIMDVTTPEQAKIAPTPITFLQEAGYILAFAKSPYLSTSPSLPAAATTIIPLEVTESTTVLNICI